MPHHLLLMKKYCAGVCSSMVPCPNCTNFAACGHKENLNETVPEVPETWAVSFFS